MAALNPFKIKKTIALLLVAVMPAMSYVIGLSMYGLLIGVTIMVAVSITVMLIANLLIKHPFTMLIEGDGLLIFNLDSTGIFRPFIATIDTPFIRSRFGRHHIKDTFDRNSVMQISPPVKAGSAWWTEEKDEKNLTIPKKILNFTMDEEEYNKARYQLETYPMLLYNSQIGSVLTKDFISAQERGAFADHTILNLNRIMEDLSANIRDFGRSVVNQATQPGQGSILQSKWFWIIIVIAGGIILMLFGPSIYQNISGNMSGITNSFSNGAISPR